MSRVWNNGEQARSFSSRSVSRQEGSGHWARPGRHRLEERINMRSRPTDELSRLLVIDLLESYARERDLHVILERDSARVEWICALASGNKGLITYSIANSAREAILEALQQEGVELPT
jgi:hypothetical protein